MLINFGFEEVNEAVIRNAQIWKYKNILGGKEEIEVLVPEVFASLYFHADKVVTFIPSGIKKYSDVSEFHPSKAALRWYRLLDKLHSTLYRLNFARNLAYTFFRRTPRQDHFYIKSGLEKKILRIYKEKFGDFKYVRMSDYYDLSLMRPISPNIREWFVCSFEYIQEMISSGGVYRIKQSREDMKKPLIVLRTRNFNNKAVIHNSKKDILKPLVEELLKFDCDVVNIGTPHLPLDINHPNYQENAHDMSISDEFELCGKASCAIMTTEAGNFMGFSATDIRIVQYDDEIFERIFKSPISLMKARKEAGLDDLDISSFVKSESWLLAAKNIYEFAIKEKKELNNINNFTLPVKVEFGIL